MVTQTELAEMIRKLESQDVRSIKEDKYLDVMRQLDDVMPCSHVFNALKLTECGGKYQYCILCGKKEVA